MQPASSLFPLPNKFVMWFGGFSFAEGGGGSGLCLNVQSYTGGWGVPPRKRPQIPSPPLPSALGQLKSRLLETFPSGTKRCCGGFVSVQHGADLVSGQQFSCFLRLTGVEEDPSPLDPPAPPPPPLKQSRGLGLHQVWLGAMSLLERAVVAQAPPTLPPMGTTHHHSAGVNGRDLIPRLRQPWRSPTPQSSGEMETVSTGRGFKTPHCFVTQDWGGGGIPLEPWATHNLINHHQSGSCTSLGPHPRWHGCAAV